MSVQDGDQEGLPTGVITCATHGPMLYRPIPRWWECVGFDGEGCGTQLLYDEDVKCCLRSGTWPPGVVIAWKDRWRGIRNPDADPD
jgi:hypothetical protein